jgi:hypothetical protein
VFVGAVFGIILVKSEVVSWYRIQEMFRFQSFHMYGILGSAMLTAFISLQLLQRLGARALTGELISVPPKVLGRGHRYWIGGGVTVFVVTAAAALTGTWTYGYFRPRLPH